MIRKKENFYLNITSQYDLDLAKKLIERGNSLGAAEINKALKSRIPHGINKFLSDNNPFIVYENDTYSKNLFIEKLDPDYTIFTDVFFNEMEEYIKLCLLTLDRLSMSKLSSHESYRIIYAYFAHFYNIIKKQKITAFFFSDLPHGLAQIIQFALAKYLDLRVGYRQIIGFSPHYCSIQTELLNTKLKSKFKNIKIERINIDKENFLKFRDEIILKPYWTEKSNTSLYIKISKLILSTIKIRRNAQPFVIFFLDETKKIMRTYKLLNYFINMIKTKNFYTKKSINQIIDEKYAVFFLHFQPENTTTPQGSHFSDQLLAFDMIVQAIPENMILYVKEHPAQYTEVAYDVHFRSVYFYEHMLKHKNVRFLSQNISTEKILNQAQYIFSINGSITWESIIINKPAFTFGWYWYSICKSALIVDSVDAIKKQIIVCDEKTSEEVTKDREELIEILYEQSVNASPNAYSLDYTNSNFDYEKSINTLAQAIIDKI